MKNCRGFSFSETLLTVVILFIITGTLIPVSYRMHSTLYNKQLELHAAETAYKAAKVILYENKVNGLNKIDDVEYHWTFDGREICVEYNNLHGVKSKCINQDGVSN